MKTQYKEIWAGLRRVGLRNSIHILYLLVFYRLEPYEITGDDSRYAWYVRKRVWLWFLLSPLFLPVLMIWKGLSAIPTYINFVFSGWEHCLTTAKGKLTLYQEINYRIHLRH